MDEAAAQGNIFVTCTGCRDIITGEWWTSLFPGGMIVLAVMAFHFIGDGLTEARA